MHDVTVEIWLINEFEIFTKVFSVKVVVIFTLAQKSFSKTIP